MQNGGIPSLWSQMRKGVRRGMGELLAVLAFVALWVFLQAWLLPRLGVPT